MSEWPPELDATAADPGHHRFVMENDAVRVLETIIPPGDRTNPHTHQWPAATYILSWDHFIRRDGDGNVLLDTRAAGLSAESGSAQWTPILGPHTLENVGEKPLHVITVEIKPQS